MTPKQLAEQFRGRGPLIHVVLDGWGLAPPSDHNAIAQAHTPVMDQLLRTYPHTQVLTHGLHVGLPSEKDLGGSEVGHMTMGAGIVLEQGPTYIQRLIQSGEFYQSPSLEKLIKNCLEHQTPLHLIGLLSDGNIHSHVDHFVAIIQHAFRAGLPRLYVHALLDGRDTPIQSALTYTESLEKLFHTLKQQRPEIDYAFASGGGRETLTMDRDTQWSKIEAGWNIHVRGAAQHAFESIGQAIAHFRQVQPDVIDQNLPGFVVTRQGQALAKIEDHHSVIFMNFRADRALEFSQAMLEENFLHFDRTPRPQVVYAGMAVYDQEVQFPENHLVGTTTVKNPFGKRILELGLKQFRLTETQKFAHVTFFYNGGYRVPLDAQAETYELIPSDQLASFAEAPAMKAFEIKEKALSFMDSQAYDYGLINFANTDMVGHTGDLAAAVQAAEAIDRALKDLVARTQRVSGVLVITADHGNADQMRVFNPHRQTWEPDTKHSLNPVPFIIYDPLYQTNYQLKALAPSQPLNLSQIAATNFILLGHTPPPDLNDSLFQL